MTVCSWAEGQFHHVWDLALNLMLRLGWGRIFVSNRVQTPGDIFHKWWMGSMASFRVMRVLLVSIVVKRSWAERQSSVYWSIYTPTLIYGHEKRIMTKRITVCIFADLETSSDAPKLESLPGRGMYRFSSWTCSLCDLTMDKNQKMKGFAGIECPMVAQ